MINIVGIEYLKANIENDEYSYPKAYKERGLEFNPITRGGRKYEKLDIRFVKDNVSVLIETKKDFKTDIDAEYQLSAYVEYEMNLTANKIIAILANTGNDEIKVWKGNVTPENLLENEKVLKNIDDYIELFHNNVNDKEKVMQNTYSLNELLHKHGISEKLRSQFVGTCLLALKNDLEYNFPKISASQIIAGIGEILENLLDDNSDDEKDNSNDNKITKLTLLKDNVLENQDIRDLTADNLKEILGKIEKDILPFINDKSTAGQDLLNLFFVTFNKYVGKKDKNQAFTPDHITHFMSVITRVDKNSVVLDPCCGSGSFLVRAMTQAIDDCNSSQEINEIKNKQIFGFEYDENIFGLATTNMLIHGDGNSNIYRGSCFDFKDKIKKAQPNIILMNPPYNGQRKHLHDKYTKTWKKNTKKDPSKGFYFVKFIAEELNKNKIKATIAVLLPVSCAIGNSKYIKHIKTEILKENTLDAVFTLPNELFYPGASASVCCMVFKTGIKHETSGKTFFGYYKDDGFKKRKNLGRVEQFDNMTGESKWEKIEEKWIELYFNRTSIDGLSVTKKVTGEDEWLCEAYMKTDYTQLTDDDFQTTINDYLSFLVKGGELYEY